MSLTRWMFLLLMVLPFIGTPDDAHAYGLMLRPLAIELPEEDALRYPLLEDYDLRYLDPVAAAQWIQWKQMGSAVNLDEIQWTVDKESTIQRICIIWGMRRRTLMKLNPDLQEGDTLQAGQKLVVFRWDPFNPTQSVGRTNRGKLIRGMPFPEGPFWKLRGMRFRHYGTRLAIQTLVDAFSAYAHAYPGAPAIKVGELARERGGRLKPHKSHRSGRDADIGYVPRFQVQNRWFTANARNMDAEKTWFFIKTLIESGNVQVIGVDRKLQRVLNDVAKAEGYTEEELARIFEVPSRPGSRHAILQHWPGHQDHMHIRFRCESWNARCDEH